MESKQDRSAPMASAPMVYSEDGSVDWGNMWTTFCALPRDGGPPHRGSVLLPDESPDAQGESYRLVVAEIQRGIAAVSGLQSAPASPGWIAITCASPGMALWLADAIKQENVQARSEGSLLLVPAGQHYTLKGEIKNVITAVAKTTHYWNTHLPEQLKRALEIQIKLQGLRERVASWFLRPSKRTTDESSGEPALRT